MTWCCYKAIEWLPAQLAFGCRDRFAFEFRYRLILEKLCEKLISSRSAEVIGDLCIVAEFSLRYDLNILAQCSLFVWGRPDNILVTTGTVLSFTPAP